jgi:1-acyl-sn-glycerol-3-phosphate acyltransferase
LASLWLSQVCRALADNCLRMFVVLLIVGGPELPVQDAAWHQVTAFFILPFILLTPISGALSNDLPKRWVLVGSATYCLCLTVALGALLGLSTDSWLWCIGLTLLMAGHAVYSPTRYALLPAAAVDSRMPLARVNGWIEMGGAASIVAGLVLGVHLHGAIWQGFPAAVAVAVGLDVIAVLAALPVWFQSDVRRPEEPGQAIRGFFRDSWRILRNGESRGTLLGLACFLAIVATGSGAIIAYLQPADAPETEGVLMGALVCVGVGAALGSVLAGVQGHSSRAMGLVPLGATGLLLVLACATYSADLRWPALALGFMGGLINVPLRAAYQAAVPADARGNGMAIMNLANYVLTTALALLLFGLVRLQVLSAAGQLWFLAALAAVGTFLSWRTLFRDSLEQLTEILLWPIYRIRAHGPGRDLFPRRGPVLVIANHAAWLDPLWLAKVLPRRLTPMMTSTFFDLPVLHFLMTRVVHAIRVQHSTYRHEAPELEIAVAALDRGEVVVLFPEGWMRRRPKQSLRQFGQGVWHILSQRPEIPVVVCWIEGGFGSYFSYAGGPPTVNKHMDWWRHIDIAVGEPQFVDPVLLADLRATREYLMQACLEARRYLGLESLRPEETESEKQAVTEDE